MHIPISPKEVFFLNKIIAAFSKSSKSHNHTLPQSLLAVLLGGCCLGLLSLYFSAGQYSVFLLAYYLTQPLVLVLNFVPFVLLCLLFFCVTNRAWAAFSLTGIVCLVFSWAQYWKLMGRNDPIYAEDLLLISEAMQMSGSYAQLTWQIVLSAILVIFATWLIARCFRGRFSRPAARLTLFAALIALCCGLYPTVYTSSSVYNSMKTFPYINQWFETNKYISRGGIYPFIHSIQTAVPTAPEGYAAQAAADLLSSYETDSIPEDQKVSVIAVMYEAFADLSTCTDTITGADPYEAFHALQSESYHGTLITNIFAGGTIDTERCFLTGFSALTNFRRPSWSYARYFSDQGYTVNGAHAGYEAFYNRRNVNDNLGISDYRFIEDYYEDLFPDQIPTDSQFLPDITQYCNRQMEDGPVFSFNVTYQNHGPYDSAAACFEREYIPRGSLSEADYLIANNYLAGVEDTALQMMAMADSFRDSGKPVVLVFFGDHKPWLGEQSTTYQALDIDIFSQSDESFLTYYSAEYIIWANPAAREVLGKAFTGTGPSVSPCFLMNVLFEQCGWEGPSYQKLTDEVMAQMPVVHTTNRYQVNGAVVEESDLSAENTRLLQNLRNVQFYLAQDAKAALP